MSQKQTNISMDQAPKMSQKIDHVRLQSPTNWGPLGGDTLIHGKGKFDLELTSEGVMVTLKDGGATAFVPLANVKFLVFAK